MNQDPVSRLGVFVGEKSDIDLAAHADNVDQR
jgi:hypothetical protein